jgi:hypothetical protein
MPTYGVHVFHGPCDLDANGVLARVAAEPWLMKNGASFLCLLQRQRHNGNLGRLPPDDCRGIINAFH